MNERMSKIRNRVVSVVLTLLSCFMLIVLLTITYWMTHPYTIIDWKISHYEMQKEEYRVGEPLTFRSAFCKVGNLPATITYQIEDGVVYLMPVLESRSEPGCKDIISSSLKTPNIPSGEYRIKGIVTYKVNPLREVSYVMYSNKFRIVSE